MNFTFYGHSCFNVEINGKNFLFDPFISDNPLAKDIDIQKIKADYILVSHGHSDHVADLITIAKNTGALVISNFEIIGWVEKQGYSNVHPMNLGSKEFDFGKLHYVPAAHSSALPDGSYGGNPGGFVLKTTEGSFYYAGDTCLSMEMKLIPHYAKLDFAILPIGGNLTMDIDDAIAASDFIECNQIIGVHYDTFGFIVIDHQEAKEKFEAKGKKLILPEIGKQIPDVYK